MAREPANRLFLTNDYSIVSKYSAIKTGYFADKILEEFVEGALNVKSWRRTPLVNRGYAARLLAVDWIVKRSILSESIDCLIILGAGYDTLPFHHEYNCCWIEIDLPEVVETKSKFVRDKIANDLVQWGDGVFSSKQLNYHLIACDLRDTETLSNVLQLVLSTIYNRRNVAIINEVCLCYLELSEVESILRTVINSVEDLALRIYYIGYEQVRPVANSPFGKVMIDHFDSLGHALKYFPRPAELRQLLSEYLNFNHVTIASMYQIYHNALLSARLDTRAFEEEPFDEYEEMDSYLSHYALVTGVLILDDPFLVNPGEPRVFRVEDAEQLSGQLCDVKIHQHSGEIDLIRSPSIQRFGHSSCVIEDGDGSDSSKYSILVSGGFGKNVPPSGSDDANGNPREQHRRLADCVMLSQAGDQDTLCGSPLDLSSFPMESVCLDRMHGQVGKLGSNMLFFNGGRLSPVRRTPSNVHFVAALDNDYQLSCKYQFGFQETESVFRWRHKLSEIHGDQMIQVGGIGMAAKISGCQPLVVWNFSSSKLGFELASPSANLELLDRHSFGMDMRDCNTLLVFGGLQTAPEFRDRPVDSEISALLWDLRANSSPVQLKCTEAAKCYGSNVHFISETEFVKIGGISTVTGLVDNSIEVIDLRNSEQVLVRAQPIQTDGEEFMMLTNATTCQLKSQKAIVSIGGGGNYFTFGTCFNQSSVIYRFM